MVRNGAIELRMTQHVSLGFYPVDREGNREVLEDFKQYYEITTLHFQINHSACKSIVTLQARKHIKGKLELKKKQNLKKYR